MRTCPYHPCAISAAILFFLVPLAPAQVPPKAPKPVIIPSQAAHAPCSESWRYINWWEHCSALDFSWADRYYWLARIQARCESDRPCRRVPEDERTQYHAGERPLERVSREERSLGMQHRYGESIYRERLDRAEVRAWMDGRTERFPTALERQARETRSGSFAGRGDHSGGVREVGLSGGEHRGGVVHDSGGAGRAPEANQGGGGGGGGGQSGGHGRGGN